MYQPLKPIEQPVVVNDYRNFYAKMEKQHDKIFLDILCRVSKDFKCPPLDCRAFPWELKRWKMEVNPDTYSCKGNFKKIYSHPLSKTIRRQYVEFLRVRGVCGVVVMSHCSQQASDRYELLMYVQLK